MKKQTKQTDWNLSSFVAWLVGILVSLAVGSAMATGTIFIGPSTNPIIPILITKLAGWIVIIGALISIISSIFNNK